VVESRRGGGGYIRVGRVPVADRYTHAMQILQTIGDELEEKQLNDILACFRDMQWNQRNRNEAHPRHSFNKR